MKICDSQQPFNALPRRTWCCLGSIWFADGLQRSTRWFWGFWGSEPSPAPHLVGKYHDPWRPYESLPPISQGRFLTGEIMGSVLGAKVSTLFVRSYDDKNPKIFVWPCSWGGKHYPLIPVWTFSMVFPLFHLQLLSCKHTSAKKKTYHIPHHDLGSNLHSPQV